MKDTEEKNDYPETIIYSNYINMIINFSILGVIKFRKEEENDNW